MSRAAAAAASAFRRARGAQVDLLQLAARNDPPMARLGTRQVVRRLDEPALQKLAEYQTGLLAAVLRELRTVSGESAVEALVHQLSTVTDDEYVAYASNPAITAKRD